MTSSAIESNSAITLGLGALTGFLIFAVCFADAKSSAADGWSVDGVGLDSGRLEIRLHDKQFATYSYRDPRISRPYFANILTPSGSKVTRNHPPQADDKQDHDLLHPGVWLAFGDISGNDFWRLKASVTHIGFPKPPTVEGEQLRFTVENEYKDSNAKDTLCRETCTYLLTATANGVMLHWDSSFKSIDREFVFGDQEEMGLGIRVATQLAVDSQAGGRMINSDGLLNGKGIWGKQADWCDYSGMIDGQFVGIMLIPDSRNFRRSWFHARDYGFIAANPFGRKAFTKGEPNQLRIPPGTEFRLRFGLFIHWNDSAAEFDPASAHNNFLRLIASE